MFRLSLLSLTLAAIVGAVPLETRANENATVWTPGYELGDSDVIVHQDGVAYVMAPSAYFAQLKEAGIAIGAPALDPSWISYNASDIPDYNETDVAERDLQSRSSCDKTYSIVTDKTQTFVDWDVQMSPVICANGDMTVSVTSGYMVANTVGGSASVDLTFVKDCLGASLGINYSHTWTTQASVTTGATIKSGYCGTMISMPMTTRRSGRQFRGCVGHTTLVGTWYADSHNDGSYAGISWVEGAISNCQKKQSFPPLSRCHGSGNFR